MGVSVSSQPSRRQRVLVLGVATSLVGRFTAAVVPLVVVPIGLQQLGASGYGAWAIALSITSFLIFADLGIGTGLMTRLGRIGWQDTGGPAREELLFALRLVSSAYAVLAGVSITAATLLWTSPWWFNWPRLLNADRSDGVTTIAVASLSGFCVNIVASLVARVQFGVGQQAKANLWQAMGSVSVLIAAMAGAWLDLSPGVFVASASLGPPVMAAINALIFFYRDPVGRQLRPTVGGIEVARMKQLSQLGVRFLVVTLLSTATVAFDPLFVAHTSELVEVPNFSVPYRMFALLGTIGVVLALPLWPLHSRAVATGDSDWIRRITVRMSAASTIAVLVGASALVVCGPWLLRVWLDGQVTYDRTLWLGFALWWVVQTAPSAMFMTQNGAEILRPQLVGYSVFLVLSTTVKLLAVPSFGAVSIPFVNAAFFVATVIPACALGYVQTLAATRSNQTARETA